METFPIYFAFISARAGERDYVLYHAKGTGCHGLPEDFTDVSSIIHRAAAAGSQKKKKKMDGVAFHKLRISRNPGY